MSVAKLKFAETQKKRYVYMGYKKAVANLTDMVSYYIIELTKLKENKPRTADLLEKWLLIIGGDAEMIERCRKEEGEIQLTDYGVSGICIFNLSRYISLEYRYSKMELKISFLPFLKDRSRENILAWFSKRGEKLGDYSIVSFLEGLLPYKLLMVVLSRAHISKSSTWNCLTEDEKDRLQFYLLEFPLLITGCRDFSFAQVCAGGVKLSSVNSSLEAKKIPHLYFVGEVLDVDGDCGGYNLGFAWMSGMSAGKHIRGDES